MLSEILCPVAMRKKMPVVLTVNFVGVSTGRRKKKSFYLYTGVQHDAANDYKQCGRSFSFCR